MRSCPASSLQLWTARCLTHEPPPGTEFLDAETGGQKSPNRDQNSRSEWLESPQKHPICSRAPNLRFREDWMVVGAVCCEQIGRASCRGRVEVGGGGCG